jgi:CheY-like chemotaxis protein/MinD-like ATPase involved in chromosome partitioning or flagellar assembly
MTAAKVLIVDDDATNREVLYDVLDDEPYTLLIAVDGQSALDMVAAELPDLILLDVMMPGLDGMAVLRKLQEQKHTRKIPVIMVTALDQDSQVCECLEAGATDHIIKPFSPTVVRARVKAALRSRATLASNAPVNSRGKVIGFVGSKGGVGNTTLALNVAFSLVSDRFVTVNDSAVLAPECKVAFVELRPNLGTVAHQLGISAGANLQRLLEQEDPSSIDVALVDQCLMVHSSGVSCLLAPTAFTPQAVLSSQHTERIFEVVSGMAETVIVDLPCLACGANRAALQRCDFVVVTVGLDASSVAAAETILSGLSAWGIGGDSLGAVLVARDPVAESPPFVQQTRNELPCQVVGVIPWGGNACFEANKANLPLVLYEPNCTEASAFMRLATRLVEEHVPKLS